ncbi:hypothetical protein CWI84_09870 [Idiomarina tyrosinivorans]|uniref:SIMPL domain-containing protein n=1 Tax=Idiomarina tyrosinivorans TaxID=1445662 RepID=A0A432ZLF2_9GAMM|nr:SIMPL domain-containing protein [Idiomarina tyrosinivorans]RUO78855.1 hypothetical protein CWI84_09870 [Idiomarina tyrosinivorans]
MKVFRHNANAATRLGVILIGLVLSACSYAQPQGQQQSAITVTGSGAVSAVPDQATIQFWIEQRGSKVSSLKTAVDQATSRLLGDLEKRDVAAKNIQSYQLQIMPIYDNDSAGKLQQQGFQVQRQIKVTLNKLDQYDQIIDLALARGVTRVGAIEFDLSEPQAMYQQALSQAFAQAQAKAQQLAQRAGLVLGQALTIREQSTTRPQMMRMTMQMDSRKEVSLPGEQTVEAQLEVTFALKQ